MPIGIGKGGGINIGSPAAAAAAAGINPSYATILTQESTGSTSYTDLATVGPSVTVIVGASGKLLLTYGAVITPASNGWFGEIAPQLSGANTLAASDTYGVYFGSNSNPIYGAVSRTVLLTGLNPGSTTVTLKYKSGQSGFTWLFASRDITAIPV